MSVIITVLLSSTLWGLFSTEVVKEVAVEEVTTGEAEGGDASGEEGGEGGDGGDDRFSRIVVVDSSSLVSFFVN